MAGPDPDRLVRAKDAGAARLEGIDRDGPLDIDGESIDAVLLPGHTPGSVAYLFRGILFTGDSLLRLGNHALAAANPMSRTTAPSTSARSRSSSHSRSPSSPTDTTASSRTPGPSWAHCSSVHVSTFHHTDPESPGSNPWSALDRAEICVPNAIGITGSVSANTRCIRMEIRRRAPGRRVSSWWLRSISSFGKCRPRRARVQHLPERRGEVPDRAGRLSRRVCRSSPPCPPRWM